MRLLHTADWHIDAHRHFAKHVEALHRTISEGHWAEVDAFFFGGDFAGLDAPHHLRTKELLALIKLFQHAVHYLPGRHHSTHAFVIPGNHDEFEQFEIFKRMGGSYLHILTELGTTYVQLSSGARLAVIAVPWLPKRQLLSGDLSGTIADNNVRFSSVLIDKVSHEIDKLQTHDHLVVLGHFAVPGGQMGSTDGIEVNSIHDLVFDTPKLVGAPIDYIAMGHFHRRQSIPGNRRTWYSGSPCPINFSETSQRGCNLVEITEDKLKVTFQKIHSWKMNTIPCEFNGLILDGDFPEDCSNQQIRLNITSTSGAQISRTSPAFEKVKKMLLKRGAMLVKPNILPTKTISQPLPKFLEFTRPEDRLVQMMEESEHDDNRKGRILTKFESIRSGRESTSQTGHSG